MLDLGLQDRLCGAPARFDLYAEAEAWHTARGNRDACCSEVRKVSPKAFDRPPEDRVAHGRPPPDRVTPDGRSMTGSPMAGEEQGRPRPAGAGQGHPRPAGGGQGHPWPAGVGQGRPRPKSPLTPPTLRPSIPVRHPGLPPPPPPLLTPLYLANAAARGPHIAQAIYQGPLDLALKISETLVQRCLGGGVGDG